MTADQVAACIRVTEHGESGLWLLGLGVWALVVVGGVALVSEIIRWRGVRTRGRA